MEIVYTIFRGISPDTSTLRFRLVLNEADIDATAHDLRDSFVSHLIYLGYPVEDVSKIAGHSSTKVTEWYYYKQLEGRQRQMQTDLGRHMTEHLGSGSIENGGKNVANSPYRCLILTNSGHFL